MQHRRITIVALLLGALAAGSFALTAAQGQAKESKLDQLKWLEGAWTLESDGAVVEEHWIAPRGGLMLGCGRTLAQDKAVFFEFMRIEERPAGVYYVAHPAAHSPGTDFMLTTFEKDSWTFENPDHDFPRVIRYTRKGESAFDAHL